jgi:hypothetical protein
MSIKIKLKWLKRIIAEETEKTLAAVKNETKPLEQKPNYDPKLSKLILITIPT